MNKAIVITAVVSATLGGVVGGAITFLTTKKKLTERLEAEYAVMLDSEVADVKRHYALLRKDGELATMGIVDSAIDDIEETTGVKLPPEMLEQLKRYNGQSMSREVDAEEVQTIFSQAVEVDEEGNEVEKFPEDLEIPFGYEIIDGEPYLIRESEYFENEPGYEMDTLTYYVNDDTLTDEKIAQIDRVDETIGARHLHMFEVDSKKPKNSFYVRNDNDLTLYEVILLDQSYASAIAGVDDETLGLKPEKKRPSKMHRDDD